MFRPNRCPKARWLQQAPKNKRQPQAVTSKWKRHLSGAPMQTLQNLLFKVVYSVHRTPRETKNSWTQQRGAHKLWCAKLQKLIIREILRHPHIRSMVWSSPKSCLCPVNTARQRATFAPLSRCFFLDSTDRRRHSLVVWVLEQARVIMRVGGTRSTWWSVRTQGPMAGDGDKDHGRHLAAEHIFLRTPFFSRSRKRDDSAPVAMKLSK